MISKAAQLLAYDESTRADAQRRRGILRAVVCDAAREWSSGDDVDVRRVYVLELPAVVELGRDAPPPPPLVMRGGLFIIRGGLAT